MNDFVQMSTGICSGRNVTEPLSQCSSEARRAWPVDWMNDFVLHAWLAGRNAQNPGNPGAWGLCKAKKMSPASVSQMFKEEQFHLIVLQRN